MQVLNYAIIAIDPEEPTEVHTIKNCSNQELQALEDCDYVIIDPLLNMRFKEGSWEPIRLGQISQEGSVVLVRDA